MSKSLRKYDPADKEFWNIVDNIYITNIFKKLEDCTQHGHTSCLLHSLNVSYMSYRLCKLLKLDAKSAARAGLLHDFFLYDWHTNKRFCHSYLHPKIALYNAERYFQLNDIERDMIEKHMFPIVFTMPKYAETIVIIIVDKICSLQEVFCEIINKLKRKSVAVI